MRFLQPLQQAREFAVPPAAPRDSHAIGRAASVAVVPALIVLTWELLVRAGFSGGGVIPTPSTVVESWWQWAVGQPKGMFDVYSGTWLANLGHSARRVSQGFLLAAVVGIPLGVLIGWSRTTAKLLDPTIQMARPIPITAWLPFAIAVFGIRDANALFLIYLGAFYPIVVNSSQGVRDTNVNLVRAARMLGATDRQILLRVVLPSALPGVFTGLRIGIGVAWMAVIAAEMIAVKTGLGYVLWDAYYVGRLDICIAAMFSVGLVGFISDRLIQLLSNRVLRWRSLSFHN